MEKTIGSAIRYPRRDNQWVVRMQQKVKEVLQ